MSWTISGLHFLPSQAGLRRPEHTHPGSPIPASLHDWPPETLLKPYVHRRAGAFMESPCLFPTFNQRQDIGYRRLIFLNSFKEGLGGKNDLIQVKIHAEKFTPYCILLKNTRALLLFAHTLLGIPFWVRKERGRAQMVATRHTPPQFSEQLTGIVPILKMRKWRFRERKLPQVMHFRSRAGPPDLQAHVISIR